MFHFTCKNTSVNLNLRALIKSERYSCFVDHYHSNRPKRLKKGFDAAGDRRSQFKAKLKSRNHKIFITNDQELCSRWTSGENHISLFVFKFPCTKVLNWRRVASRADRCKSNSHFHFLVLSHLRRILRKLSAPNPTTVHLVWRNEHGWFRMGNVNFRWMSNLAPA